MRVRLIFLVYIRLPVVEGGKCFGYLLDVYFAEYYTFKFVIKYATTYN